MCGSKHLIAQYTSLSAEQTRKTGEALAQKLKRGNVIALRGEMGAGKSELCRGIAKGLGIHSPVPSPSFTILNSYSEGRLPLYHFDWYRISSPEELYEIGAEEYIGGNGIALIEWPERAEELLPFSHMEITIEKSGENERTLTLFQCGDAFVLDGEAGKT